MLSGMGLVVLCFFASAALRLTGDGWALAQGMGAAAPATADAGKDQLLEAIRQREAQLAAFEKAQANLEATLSLADQAAEKDLARMTTVYENMKPAEAAKIFETMDTRFAAGLLARMRPDVAAQVLTGMKPETAYAVTLTIASRNARVPTR
jgi:flagellar motility protein MotE (MotC chaperone)